MSNQINFSTRHQSENWLEII